MAAAWPGLRPFELTEKVRECSGVYSYRLAPADGEELPEFLPGQFVTLELPFLDLPRPAVRCYSLSDAPHGRSYRITVKDQPGRVSSHLATQFEVGDVLSLRAPLGGFTLDLSRLDPAVLVAGGIGITPFMSMIRAQQAQGSPRPLHLFHGVRNREEHVFREELAQFARQSDLRSVTCYSQPGPSQEEGRDFDHRGRVTCDLLREYLPQADRPYSFLVCGPAAMISDVTTGLAQLGVPDALIRVESFGRPTVKRLTRSFRRRSSQVQASVTFARSGKTVPWEAQDEALLYLAERHGVPIPYACATGRCGSCATGLLAGEVVYPVEPQFPLRPGRCLPCVAQPKGDLTLDC